MLDYHMLKHPILKILPERPRTSYSFVTPGSVCCHLQDTATKVGRHCFAMLSGKRSRAARGHSPGTQGGDHRHCEIVRPSVQVRFAKNGLQVMRMLAGME